MTTTRTLIQQAQWHRGMPARVQLAARHRRPAFGLSCVHGPCDEATRPHRESTPDGKPLNACLSLTSSRVPLTFVA